MNKKKNNAILICLCILILTIFSILAINNRLKVNDNDTNKDSFAIEKGKELYDRAVEIFDMWLLKPYCGYSEEELLNTNSLKIEALGDAGNGNGKYYASDFKSLDELKEYLRKYLSEDIVEKNVVKTKKYGNKTLYKYVEDISLLNSKDEDYSYVDYVLKDNVIYCRLQTGKGYYSSYTGKYDITLSDKSDDEISYKIVSYYDEDGKITTKETKFVIVNENNNWIISEYVVPHN